jgi:hypothetical protein
MTYFSALEVKRSCPKLEDLSVNFTPLNGTATVIDSRLPRKSVVKSPSSRKLCITVLEDSSPFLDSLTLPALKEFAFEVTNPGDNDDDDDNDVASDDDDNDADSDNDDNDSDNDDDDSDDDGDNENDDADDDDEGPLLTTPPVHKAILDPLTRSNCKLDRLELSNCGFSPSAILRCFEHESLETIEALRVRNVRDQFMVNDEALICLTILVVLSVSHIIAQIDAAGT